MSPTIFPRSQMQENSSLPLHKPLPAPALPSPPKRKAKASLSSHAPSKVTKISPTKSSRSNPTRRRKPPAPFNLSNISIPKSKAALIATRSPISDESLIPEIVVSAAPERMGPQRKVGRESAARFVGVGEESEGNLSRSPSPARDGKKRENGLLQVVTDVMDIDRGGEFVVEDKSKEEGEVIEDGYMVSRN